MPDDESLWRALASEAKSVAAEMSDLDSQKDMLLIAELYERLARFAETRTKKSSS
jgi:hypothetical protein